MFVRRIPHIFAILFLFLSIKSYSQKLRFRHITSEQGISTVFVRVPMQDDKGFMWFGTQDGLNKYDGFGFKVFRKDPTSENSLPSSDITALLQVKPDLIIVGTSAGPGFFNPINEKCLRFEKTNKALKLNILAIENISDSTVLLGTDNGMYEVSYKSRRVLRTYFSNEAYKVNCIKKVKAGVLIGTDGGGLYKLSDAGPVQMSINTGEENAHSVASTSSITAIAEVDNEIFLGTSGYGLIRLDQKMQFNGSISFTRFNEFTGNINDIYANGDKLFVATAHGMITYDVKSLEAGYYARGEGLFDLNANNCIKAVCDRQGNCWIGTDLGGVNVAFVVSGRFPVSMKGYETTYPDVFTFNEHGKDKLLLGGVKTFAELDLKTGQITDHNEFINLGTALCIERQSEHQYWVGTWGNGLFRYDMSSGKAIQVLKNDLGGTVLCAKIINGYLYVGTIGDGLFKIDLKTLDVKRFTDKEGLPATSINCLYHDKQQNLWLGTIDNGLIKMKGLDNNGKFNVDRRFTNNGSAGQIPANDVRMVNQDREGNVWVATASGLGKLKADGSFTSYYERDGLPSAALYCILSDSAGNFWMSSNVGIIKFNPNQPDDKISFKTYGTKDGLVNTEYSTNSYYFGADGRMCFGGTMGFNVFRPSQIKDNPNVPPVYVIGYKRAGKDVFSDSLIMYKRHLNLSWRENYFQFELAGLDYTDPTKNKYSYMLEGYDTEWSEPSNVRYVSYTELPGGEYTFKVKAANSDGVWNEQPYEIKITVVPPFWKTKTFYAISILLVIGGFFAYTQYRTRAIKKENRILEAKVEERTKELHEKNLDIMASINYAKRIQEAMLPARDQIFKKFEKVFILYRPKDIVSGDFYWFGEKNGIRIFAAVDCTGHGVPGAFMSMIGHNQLNQIVMEKGITEPGEILNHLHRGIQAALRQGHNEISTNDGMDCSLLAVNAKGEAKWAGANRPLVLVAPNGEFSRLEGDKFPVGGAQAHVDRVFTAQLVNVPAGSMAYMFSDGYADQFGGEKGKKFMVKKLHETLTTIYMHTPDEQRDELERRFLDWKQHHEQVDDVLVVGIGL